MCVLIFSTILSQTFLIAKTIQQDITQIYAGLKVPVILARI